MMYRRVLFCTGLAFLVTLTACDSGGDDEFSLDGDEISMSDIAGTWQATRAFFSRAATGPAVAVEIVALGGTATLVIQTNGRFTFTTALPGETPNVTTGQLGFDEDLLVVIYDDEPDDFDFFGIQFSGNNLSINGQGTYDFDDDGAEEAAFIELDLVRS